MPRPSLLVLAASAAAIAVGCAHCDTCDDFPAPCTGPNCGHPYHQALALDHGMGMPIDHGMPHDPMMGPGGPVILDPMPGGPIDYAPAPGPGAAPPAQTPALGPAGGQGIGAAGAPTGGGLDDPLPGLPDNLPPDVLGPPPTSGSPFNGGP